MRKLLLAVSLLIGWFSNAQAADIIVHPSSDGPPVITVEGVFVPNDIDVFRRIIRPYHHALIVFASNGGNAYAGEQIGMMIRQKGFATAVFEGDRCASACALAWLGGTTRYKAQTGQVGFHAVYTIEQDGQEIESGMGNALAGAYLTRLGLSDEAIAYITQAAPQQITWLTKPAAEQFGIDVIIFADRVKTAAG